MKVLEVNNLCKSFKGKKILRDISFSISEGEIIGFVGPNGAGKTTTLKCLSNLIYPDSGAVKINGHNILKDREKALEGVAGIIENPGLYTFLSGKDNIEYIRRIRKISKQKMEEVIKFVGLENKINQKVSTYSLGMKQRLALAMCLIVEPKLLILDEPTNGLDPTGTSELRELILQLAKKNKTSVLVSSHILSEIEKISHKVIFIKDGQIVSIKDNKEIQSTIYTLSLSSTDGIEEILSKHEFINEFNLLDKNKLAISLEKDKLSEALKILISNGIDFYDLQEQKNSIEVDYDHIFKE